MVSRLLTSHGQDDVVAPCGDIPKTRTCGLLMRARSGQQKERKRTDETKQPRWEPRKEKERKREETESSTLVCVAACVV